jgi:hypothetical protein
MSAVELDDNAMAAARREAARRGVDVADVVKEAVQRFVVGTDLRELLDEFRRRDEASADALDEADALRIAKEELSAVREARD